MVGKSIQSAIFKSLKIELRCSAKLQVPLRPLQLQYNEMVLWNISPAMLTSMPASALRVHMSRKRPCTDLQFLKSEQKTSSFKYLLPILKLLQYIVGIGNVCLFEQAVFIFPWFCNVERQLLFYYTFLISYQLVILLLKSCFQWRFTGIVTLVKVNDDKNGKWIRQLLVVFNLVYLYRLKWLNCDSFVIHVTIWS